MSRFRISIQAARDIEDIWILQGLQDIETIFQNDED